MRAQCVPAHPTERSWNAFRANLGRRLVSALSATCIGAASIGLTAASSAARPGRLRPPGPLGTIDTVAGPGFCTGPSTPDPASSAVGALAADTSAGALWYEAGDAGEGLVTKVLNSAFVVVERTGQAVPSAGTRPEGPRTTTAAAAARLAPDGSGGVLIARPSAILRLADGGLTTLAGTTSPTAQAVVGDALGDGGPLQSARFRRIAAIATDSSGNAYVADEVDRRAATMAIRFLNRSDQPMTFYPGAAGQVTVAPGTIDTVAGAGDRDDEASAAGSRLVAQGPVMAVAGDRLYMAASAAARARVVVSIINLGGADLSAHGKTVRPGALASVATVVATVNRAAGDPARSSPLPGIAADETGNLFLAERANHRVRRVDPTGVVTTVAGTGVAGFNGNDRPATTARLNLPYDVEVGAGGRVYISDAGNTQVRFVDQAGIIRSALGNNAGLRWRCGVGRPGPEGGETGQARLGQPVSLAADRSGNVFMASSQLGRVHRLAPSGAMRPVTGGLPGAGTPLAGLAGVAVRPAGGFYVRDESSVRFVNLGRSPLKVHGVVVAPGAMGTVAGGTMASENPEGDGPGKALAATIRADTFDRKGAFVADRRGNLILVNAFRRYWRVQQVDAEGTITTLLSAPGRDAEGRMDATRCCNFPTGLALDGAGNLYVSSRAGRVWFLNRSAAAVKVHGVSVAPGAVEPVAGTGTDTEADQYEGGPALEARLLYPVGVAVDRSGNLYVVDVVDHTVRRVDTRGTITTVAGIGQRAFNGDGLKGALTALDRPTDVVIDACGNLLIADPGNDRVRRLNLVASCFVATAPTAASARRWRAVAVMVVLVGVALVATGWVVRRARRRPGAARDASPRR